MRSKTPLILMEQLIMLLVFALASAMCLWMFVQTDQMSKKYAVQDVAVLEVQSAAEQIKQAGLEKYLAEHNVSFEENGWRINTEAAWSICVRQEKTETALLEQYEISAVQQDGEVIFSIPLARQGGQQ